MIEEVGIQIIAPDVRLEVVVVFVVVIVVTVEGEGAMIGQRETEKRRSSKRKNGINSSDSSVKRHSATPTMIDFADTYIIKEKRSRSSC